jgi:uncharacterized peroxidase-related enzyme
MYERQRAHFGYLPNYATVFCHRPRLMQLWAELQNGIRETIDRRRFELVTLAAAHALRSSYCSLAHGKTLTEFFAPAEVAAIANGDPEAPLSEAEFAMVRFARQVAIDASGVRQDDVDELLRHGLSDAEIFDIAATAAARAFLSKVVEVLGALPDPAFRDLDPQLRQALTVGRDIEDDRIGAR